MSLQEKLSSLENKVTEMAKSQENFVKKALLLMSLSVKDIYSKEEAAAFLNLSPDYLYQLNHYGKLKAIKRKGQKKIYFRKIDLENYLLNQTTSERSEKEAYEAFEDDIKQAWKK